MRERIDAICESYVAAFCERSQHNLEDAVKMESQLVKQYLGREIFELLQNIDDAGEESKRPTAASFVLEGDMLSVNNNGQPFTLDTLQRLCQGRVSSKSGKYIGCKGVGFRSVRNWAEEVEIHSGEIDVRFSESYAREKLEEIEGDSHVAAQMAELVRQGYVPEFPMFRAPMGIEPDEHKVYDTEIRLKIKDPEVREHIRRELKSFDRAALLFLPNIRSIDIRIEGEEEIRVQKVVSGNTVAIRTATSEDRYFLQTREESLDREHEGSKTVRMAVAIPITGVPANLKVYSFFPMQMVESPFPALLHATFSLIVNRNDLDLSTSDSRMVNADVLERLLVFYGDVLEDYGKSGGGDLMALATPQGFHGRNTRFNGSLGTLGKEGVYFDYCKRKRLLTNVNGRQLSASGEKLPVVLSKAPVCMAGEEFESLVLIHDSGEQRSFGEYLTDYRSAEEMLVEAINSVSESWDALTRARVFKWWFAQSYRSLPRLLRKQSGEFVTDSNEPCFMSGGIKDVPVWAKISTIDKDDDEALIEAFADEIDAVRSENGKDETKRRALVRLLRGDLINLREQSSQALISPVNTCVKAANAREYVEWLWGLWKRLEDFASSVKGISFNLPATDGSVQSASTLYLGEEYGNTLGAKLFQLIDGSYELSNELLKGPDISFEDRVLFFETLGVRRFPKIEDFPLFESGDGFSEYMSELRAMNLLPDDIRLPFLHVASVKDVKLLLAEADTELILRWLFKDRALAERLDAEAHEPAESYLSYRVPYARSESRLPGGRMPSFLRHVFSRSRWIHTEQGRFAPCELMLSSDELLKKLNMPVLTDRELSMLANKIGKSTMSLEVMLTSLGAKQYFTQLPSTAFYSMLMGISNLTEPEDVESSKRLSREIYRQIIENSRSSEPLTAFYAESEAKEEFFKSGKVLGRSGKKAVGYYTVGDVYFSSSAVVNPEGKVLIDTPRRSGRMEDFYKILNVKAYSEKYKIDRRETASGYEAFEDDLKHYLSCLKLYLTEKRSEDLDKLRITPVSSVLVDFENSGQSRSYTGEYMPLRDGGVHDWLIYVGSAPAEIWMQERMRLADAIVQIINTLLNYPSQEFQRMALQLYMLRKQEREQCVEYDFGGREAIDAVRRLHARQEEMRVQVLDRLAKDFPEEDLKDLAGSIDWLDMGTEDNKQKIRKLLQVIGRDTDYIEDICGMAPDFRPDNKQQLRISHSELIEGYRSLVYNSLLYKDDEHATLVNKWIELELSRLPEPTDLNSVRFDAGACVLAFFKERMEEWKIDESEVGHVDYNAVYEANRMAILEAHPRSDEYINEYCNDHKRCSLLYFITPREAAADFKNFVDSKLFEDMTAASTADTLFEAMLRGSTVSSEVKSAKIPEEKEDEGDDTGSYAPSTGEKKDKLNRRHGDDAELLVIHKLVNGELPGVIDFLGKGYAISWISGARSRAKNVPQSVQSPPKPRERAGYDIELTSADKKRRMFIEVKSSTGNECKFIMSNKELSKSRELDKEADGRYRIVFVSGIGGNKPTVSLIDEPPYDEHSFVSIPIGHTLYYQPKSGK